jgi:hypothetical protein
MPVNRTTLLPSTSFHNEPIRIAPVCIQAAYTVTTAKRVRQILAADLECFPAGADAGAHHLPLTRTSVSHSVVRYMAACLHHCSVMTDLFFVSVMAAQFILRSILQSSISEAPHPFGCAQGRPCRKESTRIGHLGHSPGCDLFLGDSTAVEVEQVLRLLAMIDTVPFLCVMISIDDGKDDAPEVAIVGSGEIGGVKEIEGDGFAVGGDGGGHAELVASAAVVSEEQAVGAVEVNHADHADHDLVVALFLDFAHERGTSGGVTEGNAQGSAFGVLAFPGTGKRFELVERFLGGGLGESGGCGEGQQERKQDTERFHVSDLLLNLWNWVGQRVAGFLHMFGGVFGLDKSRSDL